MKSMTGIFRDIQDNRRAAALANMTWGVYAFTKTGALYKTPSAQCPDEAAAQAKAAEMTRLNPGKRFVAQPLPA